MFPLFCKPENQAYCLFGTYSSLYSYAYVCILTDVNEKDGSL